MSPRAGVYIYFGSITMRVNILAKKKYTQAVSHVAQMNLRDYLSGGRGR